MAIPGIGSGLIQSTTQSAGGAAGSGGATQGAGASSGAFGQLLDGLTQQSATADNALNGVATGNGGDLHDLTLSVQMESLSFDLAVQIRNRLVDAYQEIFRMSV